MAANGSLAVVAPSQATTRVNARLRVNPAPATKSKSPLVARLAGFLLLSKDLRSLAGATPLHFFLAPGSDGYLECIFLGVEGECRIGDRRDRDGIVASRVS